MTNFRSLFLAAAASTALTASVSAAEPGPYVGFGIGVHLPRDSQLSVGGVPGEATFKTGAAVHAMGGWKMEQGPRLELELGYLHDGISQVSGVNWNGSQTALLGMGNVLFDLGTTQQFTPYIGAGVGMVSVKGKRFAAPTGPTYSGTESEFGFQAIAGVAIAINDRMDLTLDARYLGANNINYQVTGTSAPGITDHDFRSYNIFLGLRYALNAPPAAPEVMEPAPPPPPPPPPQTRAPTPPPAVPQKFIVFFDFDRSDLRADAQRIVSEAAEYARTNGRSVINATGHADTSGSAAYNLGLSERRANAVKAELLRLGFQESEIAVSWKGESEPLVPTGDGVREPQNRRVEIVLD